MTSARKQGLFALALIVALALGVVGLWVEQRHHLVELEHHVGRPAT